MNAPDTQNDAFTLSFRIGSIPVRVEPWFWLVTALMGMTVRPWQMIAWILIVFFSILIHELGHATAAILFGSPTHIRLYSFGGLTYHKPLSRLQSIIVSLAGPFAGFALGGAIYFYYRHTVIEDEHLFWILLQLHWVNIRWGLMNLLPVLPLDGGHVLRGILGERRLRITLWVSIATGIGVAAYAMSAWGDRYIALMFGYLALNSFQALSQAPTPIEPIYRERRAPLKPEQHEPVLQQGWSQLFAGNDTDAERFARLILTESADAKLRNRAIDLMAWVMLARGDSVGALLQLDRVQPQDQVRPLTRAMALELAGHLDAALTPALKAHEAEPSEATAQLVVRLLSQAERYDEAIRVAESFRWTRPGLQEATLATVYGVRGDSRQSAVHAQRAFELRGRAADAILAARHLARSGDSSGALVWIERAVKAGFDDRTTLETDPDFASVRTLPGFAPLMSRAAS